MGKIIKNCKNEQKYAFLGYAVLRTFLHVWKLIHNKNTIFYILVKNVALKVLKSLKLGQNTPKYPF
jgi:hypothetical protein